jgi:hypothetical protein
MIIKQSEWNMKALVNVLARTLTDNLDEVKQVIMKIEKTGATIAISKSNDAWIIETQGRSAYALVADIMGDSDGNDTWRIER